MGAIGIDAGSTTTKLVLIDEAGVVIWRHLEPTDPRVDVQVERLLVLAGEQVQAEELPVAATGYGRRLVRNADKVITEISCHARGAWGATGRAGILVDIGGLDSKLIRVGDGGRVQDFAMNDKCAAGTGRFLENTAARLGVGLDSLGGEALAGTEEVPISSTCAVFAESEVIGLLARGTALRPVIRGLHRSLVKRVSALVRTVGTSDPVHLSGGVARNPAVSVLLAEELGCRVVIPEEPQYLGAYGAALSINGRDS